MFWGVELSSVALRLFRTRAIECLVLRCLGGYSAFELEVRQLAVFVLRMLGFQVYCKGFENSQVREKKADAMSFVDTAIYVYMQCGGAVWLLRVQVLMRFHLEPLKHVKCLRDLIATLFDVE